MAATQAQRGRSSTDVWIAFGLAVYAAIAVTGVQTAMQSDEVRGYNQRLSDIQAVQDEHLTRHRLLLLERATFAGYLNVERIAREELGMGFPQEVVRVRR